MEIKVTENHKPKAKTNLILKIVKIIVIVILLICIIIILIFVLYMYFEVFGVEKKDILVNNIPVRYSVCYNAISNIEEQQISENEYKYLITFDGEPLKDPSTLKLLYDNPHVEYDGYIGQYLNGTPMRQLRLSQLTHQDRTYEITMQSKIKEIICNAPSG